MNDSGANVVSVAISANVANLVAGMKEAASATAVGSAQMRSNLVEVAHGASEAGSGIDAFTGHVREMRSEMRLSNFMAGQIAAMGIASKSAAAEVTGLVSAFAIGGGIGLAIDGVKLLVTEILKGDEEIKKFADDAVKSLKALQEQVDGYLASMRGATEAEKLQHKEIGPLLRQEADLKQELIKLNMKAAEAVETAQEAEKKGRTAALQLALNERDSLFDEINKKQRLLDITKEQIALATKIIKPLGEAEDTKAAQKAADEEQAIDDKLYAHKIRLMEEHFKQRQKLLQEIDKSEGDSAKAIEGFNRHLTEEWFREEERREKKDAEVMKKIAEQQIATAKQIGAAFGTALGGMIDGTLTVAKAFKEMAKEIVKALIGVAIKSITASAMKAGGEAAAATAGIPIVGPALAIGAMTAMEGIVLGLIGSLPSAAVGMPMVPQDMPVYVHQNEAILTSAEADDWRASRPGAGGQVVVNIHAMDGVSVQRVVEGNDFRRAVRESMRNGAWP